MSKYITYTESEWITPRRKGYKFQCCDCGLVHIMDFRIYKYMIQFKADRDNRATGQVRRHRRITMEYE